MRAVTVVIFHRPPRADDAPLTGLLGAARQALAERHAALFRRAGAARIALAAGREASAVRETNGELPPPLLGTTGGSFGEALAGLVRDQQVEACVVLSSGAVPRLRIGDARRLVAAAAGDERRALTNNRFSSDVCAVPHADVLAELPPLPSDNALPRWLEELAGYAVETLPGPERLALDLDTPLDLALLTLAPDAPAALSRIARSWRLTVPRRDALRELAADPRRELLVFGRSSSRTLAWLERHVRCRVRFLAEERGLRAASPFAMRGLEARSVERPPRATLGRLLADRGPGALAAVVAELADGAILDTRVLLADRSGAAEDAWPGDEDRFASDLLQADEVADGWLRELTASAAGAALPILLGGHSLVGPGVPLLLRGIR